MEAIGATTTVTEAELRFGVLRLPAYGSSKSTGSVSKGLMIRMPSMS